MKALSNPQLRKLKALAQKLEPAVKVGKQGLSPAFIKSLDQTLSHLELVKVRFDDFKDQKKELAPQLAEKTSSFIVMRVGNVVVLYREHPDPAQRRIQL